MTSDDDNWFSDYEDPILTKKIREQKILAYNESIRESIARAKSNESLKLSLPNKQLPRAGSVYEEKPKDIVVIIRAKEESQEPNINEILVNSKVRTNCLKESEFSDCMNIIKEIKINKEKKQMIIILKPELNKEKIDRIYNTTKLGSCEVVCRPPLEKNVISSVIQGYPVQSSTDDIERNLKESKLEYKKVMRFNKYIEGEYRPTESILVEFINYAPRHVFIDYCRYIVKPYVAQPVRCYKCQRFGHIAANCKSKMEKCALCGQNHKSQDCLNKENAKCANCGENHPAYSKHCPKYIKAKEIRKIQDTKKISYATATKMIRNNESNTQESRSLNKLNNKMNINATYNVWNNSQGRQMLHTNKDDHNWPSLPTKEAQPKTQEKVILREIATQTDDNDDEETSINKIALNKEKIETSVLQSIKEIIAKETIANLIVEIIESLMPTNIKLKNSKKQIETLLENYLSQLNQNESEKSKRKLSESPKTLIDKTTQIKNPKPDSKKQKKNTNTNSTWIL